MDNCIEVLPTTEQRKICGTSPAGDETSIRLFQEGMGGTCRGQRTEKEVSKVDCQRTNVAVDSRVVLRGHNQQHYDLADNEVVLTNGIVARDRR